MSNSHSLYASKVDSRGRVQIPKKIREMLFIKSGDIVIFESRLASEVVFYKLEPRSHLLNRV